MVRTAWGCLGLVTALGCGSVSPPPPQPPAARASLYAVPAGVAAFDVVARPGDLHLYAAIAGEAGRTLARFDLDGEGHPARGAAISVGASTAAVASTTVAAAIVGDRDLVVVCDEDDEAATHTLAWWVGDDGTLLEAVDLGTHPAEDDVEAPCFVSVAASGPSRAVVLHGRDSLACPRVTGDEDVVQCPGYRAVTLVPGAPPEEEMRVGADVAPVLVGDERGWAWGLGPYPSGASVVLAYPPIPEGPRLIDAQVLDGWLATDDTLVALARVEDTHARVAAAFRRSEVLTGATVNGYDELPTVPVTTSIACVGDAVAARVQGEAWSLDAVAGAAATSVSWSVFFPEDPHPAGGDDAFAAAAGRLYRVERSRGALDVFSCEGGVLARRRADWRVDDL